MKRTILISTLLALFVPFVVVGCGGGGGDSTPSIALKTSNIRPYQTGDTWQFLIRGDDTGTLTVTVQPNLVTSPITNDDCFEFYTSGSFSTIGVITNSTFYLQDGTGSEYAFGQWNPTDGYNWISSAPGYVKFSTSPMAIGQSNGGTVTYQDGSIETFSNIVTGIEDVYTGMGKFEAYKMTNSGSINWGGGSTASYNETVWYIPGLSIAVKEDLSITYYQNGNPTGTVHLISTLESTNVVY